jgi:CRP-like cAMP-binding protein
MSGETFEKLTLFRDLAPSQVTMLRELFIPCDFYANDMIFQQETPAENLYLVASGEVMVVYKPYDGPPITVARIKAGGMVGWSAALGSRLYTSSAEAVEYSQLLRVRGAALRAMCVQYPRLGDIVLDRLATLIAERLRNTHPQVLALLKMGMNSDAPSFG